MHYCGVIVKRKNIDIETARKIFGDILIKKGIADWYSTDDYRERVFKKGRREIELKEFVEIKDNYNALPICFIDENGNVFDQMITSEFYEYYDAPEERKELIKAQARAYKVQLNKTLELLSKYSKLEDYNVCLIDYHN